MKRAQLLYAKTRKFPSEFSGDLHLTCDRHKPFMDRLLAISDKWFIRTEDFSLKKTVSGVGPYNSLERILPAMLSSDKSHPCLRQTDAKKTLYFMPWIEITKDKEFRVVVIDGRVTAISQQFFSEVNRWLAEKSEAELSEICRKIFVAHQTEFKGKLEYLGEKYVMDVALVGDEETPYFIEPNPFGAEYSSGSSLFHWIFDAEIIEGRAQFELRFVDKA
jgi:hypothetical protein